MDTKRDMLTVVEAADELGRSRKTIMRWLAAGRFPNASKIRSRRGDTWSIPVADVAALNTVEPTQPVATVGHETSIMAKLLDMAETSGTLSHEVGRLSGLNESLDARVRQLETDLEHERTARHRAEIDAAEAGSARDTTSAHMSEVTKERDRLSRELVEAHQTTADTTDLHDNVVIDLRDDLDRARSSMTWRSRRRYGKQS